MTSPVAERVRPVAPGADMHTVLVEARAGRQRRRRRRGARSPAAAAARSLTARTSFRRTSAFTFAVMLLSTGAGFALSFTGSRTGSQTLVLALWLVAYGIAAAMLLDAALRKRRRPPLPPWLFTFILLAATSMFWSESPSVTLRRTFALVGTTLVGLAIADRLEPVGVLEAVRRVALLIAVASLVLYVAGDPRVLDEVHNTLRGVVVTKNTLGRIMAVGLIASAALAYLDRRRWRACLASVVPMAVALGFTDSAGGLLVSTIGLVTIGALAIYRGPRSRVALAAFLVAGLGAVILTVPNGITVEDVAEVSGRDATLTGRTEIWDESLRAARERPLSGYGFGAFWGQGGGGIESGAAARIRARLAVPVANANTGILDVTLDVGLPGAALALLVLAAAARRGFTDARAGRADGALLRLTIVGLVLLATIAESGLLQENAFFTVLLVVAAAARTAPAPMPVRRATPEVARSGGYRLDPRRLVSTA